MFIAHLPGGYLLARRVAVHRSRLFFFGILVGSVLPDIDLLMFYFVDNRAFHHHQYLTHRPAFWLGIGLLTYISPTSRIRSFLLGISIGALLHVVLDSIAGSIAWAWPLSAESYPLVVVPASKSHWVLSFLSHWTFKLEIALTFVAVIVAWRANFNRHRN